MKIRGSRTVATVGIGAAIVATTSVGVTLAATGSSGIKACATTSHVLELRTAAGKCPKHTSAVTLGARGPRGKQGVRGPRGLPGQKGGKGDPGKDLTTPDNVVVVSAPGSDTDNGTALLTAVAALSGSHPTEIELGPGTFDIGTTGLTLPDDARLVGAGTNQTVLLGDPSNGAMVTLGTDDEIDDLTISYDGTSNQLRTGIVDPASTISQIDHVVVNMETTTVATGRVTGIDISGQLEVTDSEVDGNASTSGSAEAIGLRVELGATAYISRLTEDIDADGAGDLSYGLYDEGSVSVDDLNATIAGTNSAIPTAVFNTGQTTVRASSINAGSSGVALINTGGTLQVADSMVNGSAIVTSCVGDYNGDYVALDTSCS